MSAPAGRDWAQRLRSQVPVFGSWRRSLVLSVVASIALALTPLSAAADDPHFAFDLNVDSPTSTQDSFHVHLTEALVGAKPGVQVTITYKLVVVDPGQQEHVLQGPVSVTNSLGGGHAQSTIGYWPPQNGEFIFRVVRIDGPTETVLAERRATTDKAAVVAPALPPNVSLGGGFAITGLRITPDQPVVGLPVTIEVAATNSGPEPVTQAVPVVLTDDSGELTLATGTFTLDAGLSGTGQVSWTPDHATAGVLSAGDRTLPVVVLDEPSPAPLATPPDQPESTDSPSDQSAGD